MSALPADLLYEDDKLTRKRRMRAKRIKLFQKQRGLCFYCCSLMILETANTGSCCTIDHRIPRCRGGNGYHTNIVAACGTCNRRKAEMTDAEFLASSVYARILHGKGLFVSLKLVLRRNKQSAPVVDCQSP
jgi:5-methylcytosine-specific restriction endonuclease McrA